MDKKIKTKWIKALTSGKYNQCTANLVGSIYSDSEPSKQVGHCCLGVLASVCGKTNTQIRKMRHGSDINSLLSNSFAASCGLNEAEQEELSTMNDSGKTFKQIAKYIEKHL